MSPRDDELLFALRKAPDDLALWQVYADFCESDGHLDRAQFVRALSTRHQTVLVPEAREILDSAEGLPRAWLFKLVMGMPIAGTAWGVRKGDGAYMVEFRLDGMLRYREGTIGTAASSNGWGHWMQVGPAVAFSICVANDRDKDYSRFEGLARDGRVWGIETDESGTAWTFELDRVSNADFGSDAVPECEGNETTIEPRPSKDALLGMRRWR